jgi:hypothetical protein
VISNDLKSSIDSNGIKAGNKLRIMKRTVGKRWYQLSVHFPLIGGSSMSLRMHSTSTPVHIKQQLQEITGCPVDEICLFLSDGLPMNDGVTLRDYNFEDSADIYCVVNAHGSPKDITIDLGEKIPFLSVKVSSEALMQHMVEQKAQRDQASKRNVLQEPAQNSAVRERHATHGRTTKPQSSQSDSDRSSAPKNTFLGMRKGFLTSSNAKLAKRKTASGDVNRFSSSSPEKISPSQDLDDFCGSDLAAATPSSDNNLKNLNADPAAIEGERKRGSDNFVEKARKAGIPDNLRTGRLHPSSSLDDGLLQLRRLLSDAFAGASDRDDVSKAATTCSQAIAAPPEPTSAPPEESRKRAGRCGECGVRIGLTAITCRCGAAFCARHRYAEAHSCTFDYKTLQRNRSVSHPSLRLF